MDIKRGQRKGIAKPRVDAALLGETFHLVTQHRNRKCTPVNQLEGGGWIDNRHKRHETTLQDLAQCKDACGVEHQFRGR